MFNSLVNQNLVSLENTQQNADVEFCLIQQSVHKVKPMVLRLDGIWFNSEQEYKRQNAPIVFSYNNADAVVFQSEFNKKLTESWFGVHKNSHVIHNAADKKLIRAANGRYYDRIFGKNTEVWSCASSWRPHKRLNENIRYFLENAPSGAILAIAGKGSDGERQQYSANKRLKFLGELDYMSLLSLYKRSTTFLHLAYLDHCPNVVVDAQAAGCRIVCSSSGGTSEIVSKGIVINEAEWDFKPTKLYKPPLMDFDNCSEVSSHQCEDFKNNIEKCALKYHDVFRGVL